MTTLLPPALSIRRPYSQGSDALDILHVANTHLDHSGRDV